MNSTVNGMFFIFGTLPIFAGLLLSDAPTLVDQHIKLFLIVGLLLLDIVVGLLMLFLPVEQENDSYPSW